MKNFPQSLLLIGLIASGCASDHRRALTVHQLRRYCGRADGLVCVEVWRDSERGGGVFLFTDPVALNLRASHTNQMALGGGSWFAAGSIRSVLDTNAAPFIGAGGSALGNVIGAAAKAAGQ